LALSVRHLPLTGLARQFQKLHIRHLLKDANHLAAIAKFIVIPPLPSAQLTVQALEHLTTPLAL
ncbi:hypothetical protein, partial [Vreelandella olivaria]|uniref:hypothetical protein n=1 Tax=Vreelandella olivaria TaxID=390919 RepID=UPI00201EC2A3